MIKCPKCGALCLSVASDRDRAIRKLGELNAAGNYKLPKGVKIETLETHTKHQHTNQLIAAKHLLGRKHKKAAHHPSKSTTVSLEKFGVVAPESPVKLAETPSTPSGRIGKWQVFRGKRKKEANDVADI